jgi:carbamoyl-phosphate synthase large subunit
MKLPRVLITGVGAPGTRGTIFCLQKNFDRQKVFILGTDSDVSAVGRHFVDRFFTIPYAETGMRYLKALQELCEEHRVDVILPQNTAELLILACHRESFKRTRICVSSGDAICKSNHKIRLLQEFQRASLPFPTYTVVTNEAELIQGLAGLSYPREQVVVKIPDGSGGRGVRIISSRPCNWHSFVHEKPNALEWNLDQLLKVAREGFPSPLLLTEYLPGREYSVDVFRGLSAEIAIPRVRLRIRSGITFDTEIVRHEEIERQSLIAARAIDLRYAFGFQFRENAQGKARVIECNPRVQGTMVASYFAGANIPWMAIREALGLTQHPEVQIQTARFTRYWGGVGLVHNERPISI